jgi:hypothetical protein
VSVRVIGAGVGRTGTLSLKAALETLLGGPCYHMVEVFAHPEHVPAWHAAARGDPPDWHALLAGYRAAVDWPASAFWPELMRVFPDAKVLLSTRDRRAWWESADATIFPHVRTPPPLPAAMAGWPAMVRDLMAARFTLELDDPEAAMAAFDRHNEAVRAGVPAERRIEWRPGDGWEPLCHALGVPVPDAPFPRTNTREDWRSRGAGPP